MIEIAGPKGGRLPGGSGPVNHYALLQVRNDASTEVIRAAYKALIQKFHPDRYADEPGNADMAKLLTAAYTTLSEPHLRAAYDEHLNRLAVKGLVTRGVLLLKTTLSDDVPRSRGAHRALWLGATVFLAATIAVTLEFRRRAMSEEETTATLRLQPSTELHERETRTITLLPDKLVVTWPKDDPYASSQVVIIPEIQLEMARPRLEEFQAYIEAHQADFARALATDLPKDLRGFRIDPEGSGETLLARAMHQSFNRHHPEPIENLCPPDAGKIAAECSGIVRILFPKSFWVANSKDPV